MNTGDGDGVASFQLSQFFKVMSFIKDMFIDKILVQFTVYWAEIVNNISKQRNFVKEI